MPKEIVTLSFGSYASFVSAHYWNLQDEAAGYSGREGWSDYAACVDHEALFEEVEGRNGAPTYRPRAVLFDVVGSSGGVSFSPDATALPPAMAASASASVPTWHGGCEVHRSAPVARSPFLERLGEHEELDWEALDEEEAARQQAALEAAARQLDPGGSAGGGGGGGGGGHARHWTDFCKVLFGPRSVYHLPGSWTSPYEHSLAAGWGAAADVQGFGGGGDLVGGSLVEEAVECVRHLGEACDSLAGFQVLADDLTGFGALAAGVLGEVVQEYTGRPLLVFSLRRPEQWERQEGGSAGGPVSTAWATARARDDLSQALALTRVAELASLYVPLAAPPASSALPYLSYDAALPFHSSAILACAVDTALLPTRLTGVRSPLGEPLGGTDLHSLVRLLRPGSGGGGGGGRNLAALQMALPCPSLPADIQQLQQQLDERVRPPPHASAAAAPAGGPSHGQALYGSTAQLSLGDGLANLTPGISGREGRVDGGGRGASRAESYSLRGARTDAGPATTAAALEALDLLLRRQPHRMCVRHRCTAPMPLAVPLPFPNIFRRGISRHGDVPPPAGGAAAAAPRPAAGPSAAADGGVRAPGEGLHSVPVLTRLQATREFEGWVRGVRGAWSRAAAGAGGRAVLEGWGFGRDDVAEVGAQLQELGASFADEDDEV
ncbi:hypothetical protein PLESTB_001554800 [Pleodorina starrii]|uniref:Uncharacterized protein n=1 Tax=Pleodorina starrii TaxID=330485 RepID=A0A9W6F8U1_9CHLO|nr:hypothetical protein PLESTM_001470800 [Pleodorina starrii]GLC59926.1 hypothetical protein PLESTB_001554800 [Pleodorina starrii]GLC72848.1 hypothetical protein PLESTF_001299500 [Pleodorina starrii]